MGSRDIEDSRVAEGLKDEGVSVVVRSGEEKSRTLESMILGNVLEQSRIEQGKRDQDSGGTKILRSLFASCIPRFDDYAAVYVCEESV